MGHNAKCCCLAVILLCTAAIGAPGPQGDLTEKAVYPLEKQDDVWWAGIRDLCELAGAEFAGTARGPVILQRDLGGEIERHLRLRIDAFADQLMGKGPIEIKVGDDTYKLEIGSVELEKNGERVWDLIHEPRGINGVASASLDDLAMILGFTIGDEVDGQPTIIEDGETYRLVQGKPSGFRVVPVPVPDAGAPDLLPRPFILERPNRELGPGVLDIGPAPEAREYVNHNGALYLRAPVPAWVPDQPGTGGGTLLYGPVIRGQYGVNGQAADLLYLSIVELKQRPPVVVRGPDGFRLFPNPPGVGPQGGGMGGAFEVEPNVIVPFAEPRADDE